MEALTVLIRFTATFILALLFGLERQRSHKPIGFGTFIFVAVGSSALGATAVKLAPENPLPLLGAVITGIGFLGAGALIKTSDKVFGATTAASIWFFAIVGLLVGIGYYAEAVVIYALLWVVVLFDRHFEKHAIGLYQKRLELTTNKIISEKDVKNLLVTNTKKFKLMAVDINKKENQMKFVFLIEGMREDINKIPQKFYEKDWTAMCKVE
ncbi:MAG TPA: MgtC/SapB family protein [Candidatus Nanoarchaeia archaeon]|nr:MgtC/SapB family protein [Candidatus Nanoarchaeia archaeon]